MDQEAIFESALAAAVDHAVSDDARPYIMGDHVSIVETMSGDGQGMVLIAPSMTQAHLLLLIRAVDVIARHFLAHSVEEGSSEQGDADAA